MHIENDFEDYIEARILYNNCPLCESNKIIKSTVGDSSKHPLYHPKVSPIMNWMICEDCNHQFIDGYLTDEANELIFSKTRDYLKVGVDMSKNRLLAAKMIEKVIPYKSKGVWLDVGFGNGNLLFTANEYGFEPIGVDLRKENVSIMQALGIEAHCNLVQNIKFEKPISVVSMMDVLEHIPYPKEVLVSIHSKIEKDGCLLISMPNAESWGWKALTADNQNPYFNTIEHFHNFTKTRLESLLNECGFIPKRYGISERYIYGMEIVAQKN
jgi:2-polyprenyl-3-methyl-5-hydroxy-6-metoxy-1,4-benzoquinol methylase